MLPKYALSFDSAVQVGEHRVYAYRWVPISPDQVHSGSIISGTLPNDPAGTRVTYPVIGTGETVMLISLGHSLYRTLTPSEKEQK